MEVPLDKKQVLVCSGKAARTKCDEKKNKKKKQYENYGWKRNTLNTADYVIQCTPYIMYIGPCLTFHYWYSKSLAFFRRDVKPISNWQNITFNKTNSIQSDLMS